ncbi:MAG: tRNA (cytidine(34)-2'-O)-methyltransferase [Thermoguttaceae bacterium]|nr:tRNA (cytidine(34)-2'-O)-methyltransferase [Thermoguttaceae bacterium]
MESKEREARFHVVLVQPEIAANTGAVGRTCVGIGAKLWLVRPFGFQLSDRNLKRAGLDYWQFLSWEAVNDWNHLQERFQEDKILQRPENRVWLMSKRAEKDYDKVVYHAGDVFVFGPESTGLSESLLHEYRNTSLRIPIRPQIRSLNLSVSVGVTLYEACRQVNQTE